MNKLAAWLAGGMIAVMVAANGILSGIVGDWMGVWIIHVVGLCTISLILLIRHKRFSLRAPLYLYLPGFIGVCTTLLNIVCIKPLGAATMLALCVVGQIVCSNVIDHLGLFGMQKYPFNPKKLLGFGVMAAGLVLMTL